MNLADGPASVDGSSGTIRAVERAVSVLEYLAERETSCGPSEISRATGLAKPVVVRILRTWEHLGYVISRYGSYSLGWRIYTVAALRSDIQSLQGAGRRYLGELSIKSGETVQLAVAVGDEVVYVERIEGRQVVRVHSAVGSRSPIYASSSGKALLAWSDSARVLELAGRGLTSWTPNTLVTGDSLQRDLLLTRQRGYSVNRGEWHADVAGVGAAVLGRDGRPEAALSISFPIMAADAEQIVALGALVKEVAMSFSDEPPPDSRPRNARTAGFEEKK
jgi:DNA-binding IclR family transcriptional regulator